MKKTIILPLLSAGLIFSSAFTIVNSSGIAYETGSPSDGGYCKSCHSGGSATTVPVITASPAFGGSGTALTYVPGTTYTISINETGYPYYGFDIEIMNSNSASATTDAGTMTAIANCKNNGTGPTNVTHKSTIATATKATIKWVAPASGTAYLYAAILGANGDGNTSGDKAITVADVLTPAAANPAPVASFNASSSSVCPGSSITLTDASTNTPTSWAWTMTGGTPATSTAQNPTVSYANAGTYTVSLIATNSGGSSSSVSKTITVNAVPVISAPSQTVCTATSATITATGATSYTWSTGATTPSIIVTPSTATTYTVTGANASGCTSKTTSTISLKTCGAGISNNAVANLISIYPNPVSSDYLNINLGVLSGSTTAELYDISGRLVLTQNTDDNSMQLNLAKVSNGTYFIKVVNEKTVVASKMIIVSK